jgi:hypothetical protein
MAENFQRSGSLSNAHVGRDFEEAAMHALAGAGISVKRGFAAKIGVARSQKLHKFDLGADSPPVIPSDLSFGYLSAALKSPVKIPIP